MDSKRSLGMRAVCGTGGAFLVAGMLLGCRPTAKHVEGPPQPWEQMDGAAREAYMTDVVEPHMREAFVQHDAEKFADFGCATCHRGGIDRGDHSMPNPELPKLSRHHFIREHYRPNRELVRFMWRRVEPEMARMLGKKHGRRHFSCRSCHLTRK